MGVYGFLWVPMGVYGNSNIKNIAYFLIQEPRRFKNPIKRLKLHMCYKK